MSAPKIDLHAIDLGLRVASERLEAAFYTVRGPDAHDRIRRDREEVSRAFAALRKVQEAWPKAASLIDEADRAYDRYVTTDRAAQGCSCHINPPCSFCCDAPEEGSDQ